MKNVTKLMMALIALGLTACGQNNPNAQTGYYNQNGQWVGGTNPVMMGGNACISSVQQQLSLSFTAQGATFNGMAGLYAGNLPASHPMRGQYGTVTLSGGMQQTMGSILLQKQSASGNIQMSINPQARTASGMIQVNPQALYSTGIMNFLYSGMNYGYPQSTNPSLCVTSIALDVVYSASTSYYGQNANGYINRALVYLYLNNGQVVPMPVIFE